MTCNRRDLVKGAAALGLTAAATPLRAAEPTIGLIRPGLNLEPQPEVARLYPTGVRFLSRGIGLPGGMTPAGYDEAVPRIVPGAVELKGQGATAISIMGTSLTFYRGAAFNGELKAQVTRATDLPATSMSSGNVAGLRIAGAKRVSVATAYAEEVTGRLRRFLEGSGFEVTAAHGLGYERITRDTVSQDRLLAFSAEVHEAAPRSDALVISCGALQTLDLLVPLEARLKAPVVSSVPHALMDAMRLTGRSARVDGYGMVLANA